MSVRYQIRVAASATPLVPVYTGDQLDFNRKAGGAVAALRDGSAFHVGMVTLTALDAAQPGWLICDGSAVERSSFPALFTAVGETYGAGDGVTTFNIPTQAQCVPDVAAATPPQVITGGSVDPTTTPVTPDPSAPGNSSSAGGGNSVTGGRVPRLGESFERPAEA